MIWMHCQNNGMYRCTEAQQVPHPKKRNATLEDKEKSRCMLPNNATHVRLNHTVYTWLECSQYTYRMARRMCVTPQDKPHFFYFKFRSNMHCGFCLHPIWMRSLEARASEAPHVRDTLSLSDCKTRKAVPQKFFASFPPTTEILIV